MALLFHERTGFKVSEKSPNKFWKYSYYHFLDCWHQNSFILLNYKYAPSRLSEGCLWRNSMNCLLALQRMVQSCCDGLIGRSSHIPSVKINPNLTVIQSIIYNFVNDAFPFFCPQIGPCVYTVCPLTIMIKHKNKE